MLFSRRGNQWLTTSGGWKIAFQIAYGRDNLSMETKETILYEEGLLYDLMKSIRIGLPAIQGALHDGKTRRERIVELH